MIVGSLVQINVSPGLFSPVYHSGTQGLTTDSELVNTNRTPRDCKTSHQKKPRAHWELPARSGLFSFAVKIPWRAERLLFTKGSGRHRRTGR